MKKLVAVLLIVVAVTLVPAAFMTAYHLEIHTWEEVHPILGERGEYGFLLTMWCAVAMTVCLVAGTWLHKRADK